MAALPAVARPLPGALPRSHAPGSRDEAAPAIDDGGDAAEGHGVVGPKAVDRRPLPRVSAAGADGACAAERGAARRHLPRLQRRRLRRPPPSSAHNAVAAGPQVAGPSGDFTLPAFLAAAAKIESDLGSIAGSAFVMCRESSESFNTYQEKIQKLKKLKKN